MTGNHQHDAVHLDARDNVAVAARYLNKNSVVVIGEQEIPVQDNIRVGHKIALKSIESDSAIVKYGQVIGLATQAIEPGQWVHSHNVRNQTHTVDYQFANAIPAPPKPITDRTFMGYVRPQGRTGTRNYLAVISTVNCSASVAKAVADRFNRDRLQEYSEIDGVVAFTHESGCGMPFQGESHEMLNRVLAGIAAHPNIGGYLIIGLGCEQNTLGSLVGPHGLVQISNQPGSIAAPTMTIQDQGGTLRTIEHAERELAQLLPIVNDVQRQPCPASELIVATECGGSDGYSGITANPALGYAADRVVACGGTVILGETTEVYGAEHLLTQRARTKAVGQQLLDKIDWWKRYVSFFGADIDNNPSPGNKEGGLTTIAEKSLGAVAKGGSTALEAVYDYAARVTQRGFVFMDTPGYDPPSVTGMVAGGANVVVFTTGRGSCFGCKPTPSIKVATNTPMYEKMKDDMDINAGAVLESESVADIGNQMFELILRIASGEATKSEQLGVGDQEFVPWTIGPVL